MYKDNVLLISPKLDKKTSKNVAEELQENLGIGYLASFLKSRGIGVDIFDMNNGENSLDAALCRDYRIVGFSVHSPYDLQESTSIANMFKNKDPALHITLGGHYASRKDLEILSSVDSADSIVRGEGEVTLHELYSNVSSPNLLKNINGLSFKKNGEIIRNIDRKVIENLDDIPFPTRYNLSNLLKFKQKTAHILTSRGCPGGCSFCVAPLNKGWRMRSPSNVLKEIKELYSFGVQTFVFEDDNYIGKNELGRKRAIEIADSLSGLSPKIRYQISTRADDLDDELLNKFVDSGVYRMRIGMESFNQRQLDLYNKRITPEKVNDIMQKVINSGIDPHFSFITFDPYVSLDELDNTVSSMQRFADNIHFRYVTAPLIPVEGSAIWKRLERDNLLNQDGTHPFKFSNPDSALVWESVQNFKKYMGSLDRESQTFSKQVFLLDENTADEELLKLQKLRKKTDFMMTDTWLNILQYSIEFARSGNCYHSDMPIPQYIKQKHDELLQILRN